MQAAATDVALLERFERALEESVAALLARERDSPIVEQVNYHLSIRGKRLRPRLLLAVASQEGARFEEAVDAAVAIELLHNYSLVHDDIEDGDRLRHGRETVWVRYGAAHGVNAGDSMCALSYLALLQNTGALSAARLAAMLRVLHEANLAMCSGQGRDIRFESAQHVSMDDYLVMIAGKTS
ncbi:MAG: polyprenyl synthetase family protein, partial [Candidatus Eremiobacteraeota bacterium]|nr:polyprenyl synthetase family protein [Candidatus Eremiobacteraeota bacterium]